LSIGCSGVAVAEAAGAGASSPRLRIVHVTSYQVPGYGYEEIQLAKAQRALGHDVSILTSNYLHPPGRFYGVLRERFPDRQVQPREELVDGVQVIRLNALEMQRRVWIRGLERRLRQLRPDIVHAHNLMQFNSVRAALMRAAGRASFGLVIDDHMLYSVVRGDRVGRLVYFGYRHVLGRIVARNVDRFCAATDESRRYLEHECAVPGDIPIMPLGVDEDLFKPSDDRRREWRARLGLSDDEMLVLYTGKVITSKRLTVLAGAVLRRRRSGQRVSLVIAGDADPEYSQTVLAVARDGGDAAAIRVLASMPQEQLAGLYAAADLAVWPGTESMAIFEALASGLPVIVSRRSAYAGIVSDGAGLTFEPDDEGSLAAAISRLSDRMLRTTMGETGRRQVEGHYSWRRSAERYLSVYMQIHEARRRP
jgi:glycosyltransferase involved in cell wall biosynthesis